MDKKFFDNTIIAQYAVTGVPLKVYVDSRYLTITDADDVENPLIGQGMEPNGEMEPFSYQDIDHLLVADNIIDLETYNTAMADQFKSDEPEEAPEGDEEAPEEEGEEGEEGGDDMPDEEVPEEEPEEEPTTEEGFDPTGISLSEITKDVKKAREKALDAEEKALKDKRRALDDEPLDELTLGGPSGEAMLQDLHRETDPAKQKKMKIKLGREKYGAYSDRSALEDADYALKKFRQQMQGYTGDPIGVYDPSKDTYKAKAKAPKVRWTQKKYDRWIDDVSSNEGWRNAYDMAQNANYEPGLIDWVKKNVVFNDETPLERIQYDIEAMAESVNEATDPYKSIIDKWTPPNLLDFAKELRSMDDATRKGFEEHVAEMADVTRDSEWMGMIKAIEAIKRKYNMKESKKIREVKGRPYGLSKEETLEVAKRFAKALSITDGVKVTVNMTTLDEDSFDLDYDGVEFDGGSYNIYDDGAVKNMATMKTPTIGYKDDSVQSIVKYLKKHYGKLAKNEAHDFPKGPSKAGVKRLIKDVEEMLDTEIDANGDPLTNETEMILQKELKRLKALLRESVNEGIDGPKVGDKVQNQYDGVIATIKSIDGNSVTVVYDDMKSLRNEFGPEAKEFYNQSEKLPMAKFKKAWDRKEYIAYPFSYKESKVNESINYLQIKELLKHINGMGISKSDKDRMKSYLQKADIDPRADIKDLITHTKEILDIKEKEEISEVLGKVRQPSDEEYELAKRFADSKGGKLGSIGINKKDGSINIKIDDEKFILDKKGEWKQLKESMNEGALAIGGGIILALLGLRLLKAIAKGILGRIGRNVPVKPEKLKDIVSKLVEHTVLIATKKGVSGSDMLALVSWKKGILDKIDSGEITKLKDLSSYIGKSDSIFESDELNEGKNKIACLDCDEVNTEAKWKKNKGFCPSCKTSTQGVAESVNEANSYDSWKERGNQLEKQAMADAINAFGKAVKRKDFEEMVDMFVSDREINGGEYLDAFRIVLKKYKLEDEFRKQLADLDITKTPYEMNEFGPGYSPQGMTSGIPALVNRIGDLDVILMKDRKAEREWEEMSQRYLDGEEGSEYWGDLDDQELEDAIDDAESLMRKYNLGESVNENISSPYIYQVGDLVQNVNPTCPHHGSKGIVMSIEPEELTYSVTNSGDTFKPGARLTKTLDQLEAI